MSPLALLDITITGVFVLLGLGACCLPVRSVSRPEISVSRTHVEIVPAPPYDWAEHE